MRFSNSSASITFKILLPSEVNDCVSTTLVTVFSYLTFSVSLMKFQSAKKSLFCMFKVIVLFLQFYFLDTFGIQKVNFKLKIQAGREKEL